jgi:glycosyltransferase involved in cell wall biosynthesis
MTTSKLIRITTVPQSLKGLLKGQLGYMNSNGFKVVGVSSPGKQNDFVRENEGIEVKEVAMSRQITPFMDLVALLRLIIILKQERPQIVHTHTPKAGILGMLAAKLVGAPIRLHTVAGMPLMESTGFKRILLDAVEKLTYACATKVYPNSKGLEDFILENNFADKRKIKVIAEGSTNGIDTNHFNPSIYTQQQKQTFRKKLGIGDDDFVFIFVGRLVGGKGINELVEAFKNLFFRDDLREKIECLSFEMGFMARIKLLLVGPQEAALDPLRPETLLEIQENPNIIALGYQEDVRPYFLISNALVFPSYREGFPNVVMQAGLMGLPSIVSDINGCNEIIVEGVNGLIIPPKNPKALKDSMLALLEDTNLYAKLQSQSRELITTRYEQRVVWEALLVEYIKLLKEKGLEIRS